MFTFIKHSLYGDHNSRIEYIYPHKSEINRYGISHLPFVVRCFQDFIISFFVINKINDVPIFIGINTLNAFIGLVLKKLGKVDKVIFYTAEYSLNRFNNKLLNSFYLFLDGYCARNSDEVWSPSTRIVELRMKMKNHAIKQLFVPNTPLEQKPAKIKLSKLQNIILVGTLSRKIINFDLIFDALRKIIILYPNFRLIIIGSGDDVSWVIDKIKDLELSRNIKLLGYKNHNIVLDTIKKCDLGLAIYSGLESWTYYGDSMKVRDYLACGIPVIMTDACSTADDVRKQKVGYVINSSNQLYSVINNLCNHNEKYIKLQQNVRRYNKQVSLENILMESALLQTCLTNLE